MPGTMSRARQTAEAAFDKTQSQFLSRTRALEEKNTEAAERAEKNSAFEGSASRTRTVCKIAATLLAISKWPRPLQSER